MAIVPLMLVGRFPHMQTENSFLGIEPKYNVASYCFCLGIKTRAILGNTLSLEAFYFGLQATKKMLAGRPLKQRRSWFMTPAPWASASHGDPTP